MVVPPRRDLAVRHVKRAHDRPRKDIRPGRTYRPIYIDRMSEVTITALENGPWKSTVPAPCWPATAP